MRHKFFKSVMRAEEILAMAMAIAAHLVLIHLNALANLDFMAQLVPKKLMLALESHVRMEALVRRLMAGSTVSVKTDLVELCVKLTIMTVWNTAVKMEQHALTLWRIMNVNVHTDLKANCVRRD